MFGFFKRKKAVGTASAAAPEDKALAGQVAEIAEQHIQLAASNFGTSLGYTSDDVFKIDTIISTYWDGPPVFMEQVVTHFGSHLGETIRRLHGGYWTNDPERGSALTAVGGVGLQIYPFDKIQKRFANGMKDSISDYYRAIVKTLDQQKTSGQN